MLNDYANKNNVILYLNEKDKEDYPFFWKLLIKIILKWLNYSLTMLIRMILF